MRHGAGFTLIELMVVITIVGVLALFALPEMGNLIKNNRIKDASLNLYTSLTLARSEAIKRNVNTVSMIAAAGGWQNGWTVKCVDSGGSCGGADIVIGSSEAVDPSITLSTFDAIGNPAAVTTVTYNRDGRIASNPIQFRLTAGTNNKSAFMRCVFVDASGRPRTKADTNNVDSDGCN